MNKAIIIGTRGSDLALWQANHIKTLLKSIGHSAELKIIKTQGDQIQHLPLNKLEGKGFFTKELEEALLYKTIDIAVHSHKDLPTLSPAGLCIAAVSDREDPSELLLIHPAAHDAKQLWGLKKNAVVGTSSGRRQSQLLAYRSDIQIKDLRGNVPTRIQKLSDGQYDAILIAAAGVERLKTNIDDFIAEKLAPTQFVPAPAQGVLAIQARENDTELIEICKKINHHDTSKKIAFERKVLQLFEGGCQLPLGAYCETGLDEEEKTIYRLWVSLSEKAEQPPVFCYYETPVDNALGFAEYVVKQLKGIKPQRVFISRQVAAHSLLGRSLKAQGFTIDAIPLIEIKSLPVKQMPETAWVFFSSKHAVAHYFAANPVIRDQRFGVIGKATADALRKFGQRATFIGQSTDTKAIGKQFAARVGKSSVLFPVAKGSMRSIQHQFQPGCQIIDVAVYETITKDNIIVDKSDIYLFTSPSNVEAFFRNNQIPEKARVIAMGGATAASLKKQGIRKCGHPHSFDDLGLLQVIYQLAN